MIRNYQRSGGGGTVDLVPIYNSLNAIQNEINSLITVTKLTTLTSITDGFSDIEELSSSVTDLNASVTALSTAFTSHKSLYDWKFRTLESNVKSSINSLSSSIMDINSIISTLSTATGGGGGGGVKTLTNPTESGHLFTDAVLYTGPDIDAPYGQTFNNAYNTYMQGVTWKDYPSTVTSVPDRTMPAYFGGCVVYGVLSYDNVYAYSLLSCTAQTVVVNNCYGGAIDGGSYSNISFNDVSLASAVGTINTISASDVNVALFNKVTCDSILLSKCNSAFVSNIYANHLYIPYCSMISMDNCRIKDVSIDYPSTVTSYNGDYVVTLEGNTIDKINASLLRCTVNNNDIWTANLYMDYDLMQSSVGTSAGYFNGNTINELSIFNNDHGTGNTTNNAISKNGMYLGDNSLRHVWYELYSPLTVSSNNIETLENTLGASLYARSNSVQEWDCEMMPFSALLHNTTTTASLVSLYLNTIGKMNFYHGFSDKSITNVSSLSQKIYTGFNRLFVDINNNSVNYATIDMPNPIRIYLNQSAISAYINVGGALTVECVGGINTLNLVKNERFASEARNAVFEIFNAHSLGLTNVYPVFDLNVHVDSLNMYLDGPMSTGYTLSQVTANTVNIRNFASMSVVSSWLGISNCSLEFLNYEQLNTNRIRFTSNTIDYCSITGGNIIGYSCSLLNIDMNINAGDMRGNTFSALGGTARYVTLDYNSLTLGGFYYNNSSGSDNTVARFSSGIMV